MKYILYLSYRSETTGRWGKYRYVDSFNSFKDAEYYRDMILNNHLSGFVRAKIS